MIDQPTIPARDACGGNDAMNNMEGATQVTPPNSTQMDDDEVIYHTIRQAADI